MMVDRSHFEEAFAVRQFKIPYLEHYRQALDYINHSYQKKDQQVVEQKSAADDKAAFEQSMLFPLGEPNTAYAKYFIGQSYLAPLSTSQVGIHNVTFEPGCRNNWHIHHAQKGGGQILVCVAGEGWYQEWGKPAQKLHPGDVVNIAAGVKHWHGATANSWFAHLAIEVPGIDTSNEWLEPVDDKQYKALEPTTTED